MNPTIETERLLLRRWRSEDLPRFRRINADSRVMEFMPGLLAAEESDRFVERIEAHFDRHGFGLFSAELKAEQACIGYVGLMTTPFDAHFTPAVEIGWRLDAEYWNRGLATEGARAVLQYAFDQLALEAIVSFTVHANAGSRRVMHKLGMSHHPADDFDHPRLPEGDPLRRHVLYRIAKTTLRGERQQRSPVDSGTEC